MGVCQLEKRRLRPEFLSRRASLAPGERVKFDLAICERVRRLGCFAGAGGLALYAGDGTEPDLLHLSCDKRVFLPRYAAEARSYEWVEIHDPGRDLVTAKFNLREPRPGLPAADPSFVRRELLHLVPAVACTKQGVRLGRGGGFYDRMLDGVERPVIGVIYACQLAEELPEEEHDRRMDIVVTEAETYECSP